MSRNAYVRKIHTEENQIIEVQQVQMASLSHALKAEADGAETPLLPVVNPKKTQRSERRAQARKHKSARYRNAGTQAVGGRFTATYRLLKTSSCQFHSTTPTD